MPINYNDCKVYKIVCNHTNEEWFNVTATKRLCQRLGLHKTEHKKGKVKDKKLKAIMDNGNYYIEFVRNQPCCNKEELNKIKKKLN